MYFTEQLIKLLPQEITEKIFSTISLRDVILKCNYHAIKYILDTEKNDEIYKNNDIYYLKSLLESNCKENDKLYVLDYLINKKGYNYETKSESIIYSVIEIQNSVLLKEILNRYKININYVDRFNNNFLHYCVSFNITRNMIAMMKIFIERGCNINALDDEGEHFLFEFIRNKFFNDKSITKTTRDLFIVYLINKGININIVNIYKESLFTLASKHISPSLCKLFVKHNININVVDRYGNYPFMFIDQEYKFTNYKKCKMIEKKINYLMKFYDLNVRNYYDETILHRLAIFNYSNIMSTVIKNNLCDITIKDVIGDTCFHKSIIHKNSKCFDVIYDHIKYNINHPLFTLKNKEGNHVLFEALNNDDYISKYIIERVINKNTVNVRNNYLQTPFHLAVVYCDLYIIKLFIENNVDINSVDMNGDTALDSFIKLKNRDEDEDYDIKLSYLLSKNCVTNNLRC